MRLCFASILFAAASIAGCHMSSERDSASVAAPTFKRATPPTRSFHVRYEVEGKDLPAGKPLRLWIPVPSDDSWQAIKNLRFDAPLSHQLETEPVHRNRMLYIEGSIPASALKVVIEYDVDRWERVTDPAGFGSDGSGGDDGIEIYRRPSKLAVVNDEVKKSAQELSQGKTSSWAKARAFYDFIELRMTYDKPAGKAWGRGDTEYACAERVGNCTDFHSYFTSLCHAAGIPARFQIGLYGDYAKKPDEEYKAGNYHCWAEFHVPGKGWVPVDISEADKDPVRRDYFFGGHTDNRVTLCTGRDLDLAPKQAGAPLNYFVNPYAEIDGAEAKSFSKTAYWKDSN
ncbi:MAG: transglutaminase-like domain-containing protein [Planctomycetes bacterium]|nr:transglutaminase-like domain-containing protein [Planctomycetota bacterium]